MEFLSNYCPTGPNIVQGNLTNCRIVNIRQWLASLAKDIHRQHEKLPRLLSDNPGEKVPQLCGEFTREVAEHITSAGEGDTILNFSIYECQALSEDLRKSFFNMIHLYEQSGDLFPYCLNLERSDLE